MGNHYKRGIRARMHDIGLIAAIATGALVAAGVAVEMHETAPPGRGPVLAVEREPLVPEGPANEDATTTDPSVAPGEGKPAASSWRSSISARTVTPRPTSGRTRPSAATPPAAPGPKQPAARELPPEVDDVLAGLDREIASLLEELLAW